MIVSNVIFSISAVFKTMKLVAFLLLCLGLAECASLRRPVDKALKDAIKCFQTTLDAFERGNCSSQRATELIQEVTELKKEVIESNLTLPTYGVPKGISKIYPIMEKLDKCHKLKSRCLILVIKRIQK